MFMLISDIIDISTTLFDVSLVSRYVSMVPVQTYVHIIGTLSSRHKVNKLQTFVVDLQENL